MLRKFSSTNDKHIRSGLRAFLFLVPVFGLQYAFYIVPFDPFESCATYLFVLHYALTITEALQGAIVATIFCFFNKEVSGKENQCNFQFAQWPLFPLICFPFTDSNQHTEDLQEEALLSPR